MSQSAPGRFRRAVFMVFATLGVALGVAGTFLVIAYWSVPKWQARLEPLLDKPEEGVIWQVMVGLLAGQGALALLAWLFSFDTRASKRPRAGMASVLAAAGLLLGATAVAPPTFFSALSALSLAGVNLILASAVTLPFVWLALEAAAGGVLNALARWADAGDHAGLALFFSRLLLLFRPGGRETLRSVALARFRRGDRGERTRNDLQAFFDEGDLSEELVDALCRLAAENRDAPRYLFYLTRLHVLRPEDDDLAEALIEENLAQGNFLEALRLVEKTGVGESLAERERHARLLLANNQAGRAVEIAAGIAADEGIPFTLSNELLRRAVEVDPTLVPALNLLAEQALAGGNVDRAIKRFEESVRNEANQPDIKRRLLALYRETHQIGPMERLLAEFVGDADTATDLALACEYADALTGNKKVEEAWKYLSRLLERFPRDFEILDRSADALCRREEWTEAAEVNNRAIEAAKAEEGKARCRSRAAQIERALLTAEVYDLQQEVAARPQDADLALQLIRRFVESGQTERAINQADNLLHNVRDARPRVKELIAELGLKPEGPFILLTFLADLHLEDAEYEEALGLLEPLRARALEPDAVEAQICQRILQRVPNHLEALRRMGEISRREHRFSDMVHYFVLFAVHGGEATDEINRALFEAYENLGDYKNAKRYGQGLVDANPADDRFALRLAELAFQSKAYDDALEYARVAGERNPKNYETQRLVSRIDRIRRESLAKGLQQKLDRGEATTDEIEDLADLYRSLDGLDKCIPLYQRAARDAERATRARVKLAVCLGEKGLYDLADETLAGIQIPPDSEETPLLLDLLYQLAGQFEAERMVERAARVYKTVFLVDAGYRDVVKKIEKYA